MTARETASHQRRRWVAIVAIGIVTLVAMLVLLSSCIVFVDDDVKQQLKIRKVVDGKKVPFSTGRRHEKLQRLMDLLLEESAVDPFAAGFTRKANAGSSAPPAPACAAANEEVEPRERPEGRLDDAAPP